MDQTEPGWAETWEECQQALAENGVPAAAVLIDADGTIVSRGRNQRYQRGDITGHAHVEALRNAPRVLSMEELRTMYFVSTGPPCIFCAGMMVHFGIRKNVSGMASAPGVEVESVTFLREHGVEVVDLQRPEMIGAWIEYIQAHPDTWQEDFGTAVEGLDVMGILDRMRSA